MVCYCLLVIITVLSLTDSRSFTINYEKDCYEKDGKCFRYISGEMHYFRIPTDQWLDRILKLKAAGFNTIQTYIPWNVHQPIEDAFNTVGIANLFQYLEIADANGISVIVRPGPFLATEWDYGGFPAWLLKGRPTLEIRRNETVFMFEVRKWYKKLLPTLVPYLYENGGPIIAAQVENEFGSNQPCDAAHYDYLEQLRDIYREHLGPNVVLLTVDGDSYRLAKCGNIDGLYSTVNFGVGGGTVEEKFAVQRKKEPRGPFACSAFFSGWLDHWGHMFNKVDAYKLAETWRELLEYNNRTASISMYMFHGGTNFGYMQGSKGQYQDGIPEYPEIWGKMTSYDYDAPLSEAGDTTWKYHLLRNVTANYSKIYEVPKNSTKEIDRNVQFTPKYDLFDIIDMEWYPKYVVKSEYPLAMEEMGQNHGFVIYTATIPDSVELPNYIHIPLFGDRIYIYTRKDGFVGMATRNRPPQKIEVKSRDLVIVTDDNGHTCTGHVRYPYYLYQKGLISNVTLGDQNLTNWTAYLLSTSLPYDLTLPYDWMNLFKVKSRKFWKRRNINGYLPTLYMAVTVGTKGDTFIDTQGWGKGMMIANGHNLGRYWPLAGPQKRLFCPNAYCGSGEVLLLVLFELEQAPMNVTMGLRSTPLVDGAYDGSQL